MITNIIASLTSFLVGVSMLFHPTAFTSTAAIKADAAPALIADSDLTVQDFQDQTTQTGWPFKGDPAVKRGLGWAAAVVTSQRPLAVVKALKDGSSIAEIAQQAGRSTEDVLAEFDARIKDVFDQAVKNGKLPASLAQSRVAWFQAAARQMVNQPGLVPAYPGLHQLHVAIILASMKVAGLERAPVVTDLKACQSLDEILAANGHTGQEAVDLALQRIDGMMDNLVADGKLSQAQRDSWHTGINTALEQMLKTPGLHVAGKECSQ
jgi:hypothetical protein